MVVLSSLADAPVDDSYPKRYRIGQLWILKISPDGLVKRCPHGPCRGGGGGRRHVKTREWVHESGVGGGGVREGQVGRFRAKERREWG